MAPRRAKYRSLGRPLYICRVCTYQWLPNVRTANSLPLHCPHCHTTRWQDGRAQRTGPKVEDLD